MTRRNKLWGMLAALLLFGLHTAAPAGASAADFQGVAFTDQGGYKVVYKLSLASPANYHTAYSCRLIGNKTAKVYYYYYYDYLAGKITRVYYGESPFIIQKPPLQPQPKPQTEAKPRPLPQPDLQPQPGRQPAPEPAGGLTADERHMVELVNQERARHGLSPLKVNMELVKVARLKALDMVRNGYFSHTSPTYGSPFAMLRQFGITYRTAGENLAGAPGVELAHQNLMNSPGHRANILNSAFTEVGIGVVEGSPYGKIFVQMFIGR